MKQVTLPIITALLLSSNLLADSISIRESIFTAIENRSGFGAYEIEIDASRGIVTLSGEVASESSRAWVEEVARTTDGVREVRNDLTVKGAFASGDIPSQLASAIRDNLKNRKDLTNYDVNIEIEGETAILKGSAARLEDKLQIEEIARRTEGVRAVRNEIALTSQPSDTEVTKRVIAALNAHPEIDISGITVNTRNGVVTISGVRPSHRDRDRILSVALMVEGVREIESELRER